MSVSEWREVTLGDVCDSVSNTHPFEKAKLIFLNTSDVYDGSILHNNYSPVAEMPGQAKKSIKKGDILYSEIRPKNKRYAMVNFDASDYVVSTKFMVIRSNGLIVNKFLYLYLTSNEVLETLQQVAEARSGTFPQITFSQVAELKLNLPPIPEQKAIVATLSALDDMIELNNQINKILEEMVQAIFKSWFVDFEPFKDEEFEESELGLIPKGWRVAALDEIATYLNGLAMQKYPPSKNERGLPVLKIKELRQGFTDGNSDICSESIDNSYIINDGDIIFSWSGSLLVDIWCGGRCGLNQHLFKVTSASYNKWFYYMWTRYHLERFIAIAKDKATTMGHIQRKHLSEAKVLIPEPNTLAFMDSVMQPIIDLVIANKVENKTLSTIRDTLLPKLMTGEIRVPVEEVV